MKKILLYLSEVADFFGNFITVSFLTAVAVLVGSYFFFRKVKKRGKATGRRK